ncbi:MAG: hypothetical protein ACFFCW_27460 [Candidatus Hodarchaeota archaeon]
MIDGIVTEHILHHDATNSKPKHESPTSFKQIALLFQTAFPDAHIPLFNLIAEETIGLWHAGDCAVRIEAHLSDNGEKTLCNS